jgi:hypothetical protein
LAIISGLFRETPNLLASSTSSILFCFFVVVCEWISGALLARDLVKRGSCDPMHVVLLDLERWIDLTFRSREAILDWLELLLLLLLVVLVVVVVFGFFKGTQI